MSTPDATAPPVAAIVVTHARHVVVQTVTYAVTCGDAPYTIVWESGQEDTQPLPQTWTLLTGEKTLGSWPTHEGLNAFLAARHPPDAGAP